ncbi:MAG: ABC transporter permease subunit [Ectothiorhodospiraceae bacterium]|nr:ABC transporter permease subunit [Chromatiales bacterium]MCP5157339.1 ABC transporter permease subunit [Ectothiorhodospiraceae bacterium]
MSALGLATHELRTLLLSPLAWVLLALSQVMLGWSFILQLWGFERLAPQLEGMAGAPGITAIVAAPVLRNAAVVLLFLVPLLTMRSIAEERRSGSIALLLSSPVTVTTVVLGKFLGAVGFVTLMLLSALLLPLSLLLGSTLDLGLVACAALGVLMLGATACAIGLLLSSLTESPPVAAALTLGALLLLWALDEASGADGAAGAVVGWLSLANHLEGWLRGVADSRDAAYFGLLGGGALALTIRRLDALRTIG